MTKDLPINGAMYGCIIFALAGFVWIESTKYFDPKYRSSKVTDHKTYGIHGLEGEGRNFL